MTSGDGGWIKKWLSEPQLVPYLAACNGDEKLALRLYQWNLGFSQAILGNIAIFKITLWNKCGGPLI